MKKTYLAAAALLLSTVSYSQWNLATSPHKKTFSKGEISPIAARHQDVTTSTPAMRLELLHEDFNSVSGALPANLPTGWTTNTVTTLNPGTTPAFKVHNSTTANAGGYWPVPVTTPNNKFAGANDDSSPCNCDYIQAYIQTPELDFSSASSIVLSFDIFHDKGFGGGDATVQVSTDGGVTFNVRVLGSDNNGNDVTNLPIDPDYWQTIIHSVADLTGQPSVIFRFEWTDNGEWASGFAVDNIIVGELPDHDLKADKVKFGNWMQEEFGHGFWDYSQVPLSQASPVNATAIVSNIGANDESNINVSFDVRFNDTPVSGSPFMSDQTSATLVSLDKDTLSVQTDYTPTATGTVKVIATVNTGSPDAVPANDAASNTMQITQHIYARDAGAAQAFVQPSSSYEFGNLFDIYNDEEFGGILFAPGGASDVGAIVQGFVYEFLDLDNNGPVLSEPIAETIEHYLTESEMNNVNESKFTFLPFFDGVNTGAVTLEAGKTYLVTIASAGDARISVAGSNEWVVSWLFSSSNEGWSATLSIPMVRLTTDASLNVANVTNHEDGIWMSQNMPNPAGDYTLINYHLNTAEKVSLTIRDMSGRIVSVIDEGFKTPGNQSLRVNAANLSSGVYSYTLTAGTHSLTKRMMVK